MKFSGIIFTVYLLISCSGTKRTVESELLKLVEVSNTKIDSSFAEIHVISKDYTKVQKEEKSQETIEAFNQILSEESIEIHELWDELLKVHVSDEGNVNYKKFKTDHDKLQSYINSLDRIYSNEDFQLQSKDETLAFWINAYNAMTIDLILRHYPIKSIKDIDRPWEQRLWKLSNKWYNLDEIEHQILRKMDEPRIHFAIVCASYSCPKLLNEAYKADTLEEQLTNATKEFLNDLNRNNISENSLELSKIFQWFSKDFKEDGSIISFLNKYSEIEISENAKIKYKDYNWDLNE